jgi:uncharacterized protein DUF6220
MRQVFRQIHAWVAWLLVAGIVLQFWLAGSAIPQLGGTGSFETHQGVGLLVGLITLVLFLTALPAGLGRRRVLQSLGFVGLFVVQSSLAYMDPGLPAVAALHPVNGLLMFVLSLLYARAVWRERAAVA